MLKEKQSDNSLWRALGNGGKEELQLNYDQGEQPKPWLLIKF